jgi:hypothetical protein
MAGLCRLTSIPEMETALLEITRDSLGMTDREEFLAGCRSLLASGQKHLFIDLRGLRLVFSVFVGTVMDVNVRARADGRRLTVLAGPAVAKLFRSVAGGDAVEIDGGVAQPEKPRRRISSRRSGS